MNKQFLISALTMTIATLLAGFVVHATLLSQDYAALPALYRSDEDQQNFFTYMLLAHVLIGIGLTWIYRMGKNDQPWLGQGIRFGIAIAVLTTIPTYLVYYAVQPMPAILAIKQILFDSTTMLFMGVLVAFVNRK